MSTHLKLFVVGDGAVGKRCLLTSYTKNAFPSKYAPSLFDPYFADVNVDGIPVSLKIIHSPGQDEYDSFRCCYYPEMDVVLICFSIEMPSSFENIEYKWIPEVRQFCPNVPIILVACQIDLRSDPKYTESGRRLVTYEEGVELGKKLGVKYCETSARTRQGLKICFDEAVNGWMKIEPRHEKTNKVVMRPEQTHISVGIRPVRTDSLLRVDKDLSYLHADSEDFDQTLRLPWVYDPFVVFLVSRLFFIYTSI